MQLQAQGLFLRERAGNRVVKHVGAPRRFESMRGPISGTTRVSTEKHQEGGKKAYFVQVIRCKWLRIIIFLG